MVRQRLVESALLIALSVAALIDSLRVFGLKSATQTQAAHVAGYEMLLGGLLVCLTIIYLLRDGRVPGHDWANEKGLARAFVAFGILLAYALTLPFLGYMLGTALVLIALLRIFSSYRLVPIVALSSLGCVGSAWLWAELVIALPKGFIPWP